MGCPAFKNARLEKNHWLTEHPLFNIHEGRPAVILGGGPSALDDLKKAPSDAVIFGINHHATRFVKCDYIVFNDMKMAEWVKDYPGIKLSIHEHLSEYDLRMGPKMGNSSSQACWVAWLMGCQPILLAGMGCYQEAQTYCHELDEGQGIPKVRPLNNHFNSWKVAKEACPGVDFFAISGPLISIFGGIEYGR